MVKYYAWEPAFRSAVMDSRAREAGILRGLAFWQVGTASCQRLGALRCARRRRLLLQLLNRDT